jgi:PAS domain S-box-containing protein
VLGGPVACLACSTISVTVLSIAGVVAWSSFLFSWWTWWVGDTIGVLVFAPLALLAVPDPHPVWRRRRGVVGIPLVLGFAAVTVLFLRVSAWERARLHTDFERRAATVEAVLRSQLSKYEEVVTSLASFFDASIEVTRSEFHAFCTRALAKYPAIAGLSWNPRVVAAQRDEIETRARGDGFPQFAITERAAGEPRVAGERAHYVPVFYVEPVDDNLAAVGYDIASDAVRRDALARAERTRKLAATQRIDLVQAGDGEARAGVLLVAPLFHHAAPQEVFGYAVGAFRLQDLVETALTTADHDGMAVALLDAGGGDAVLYRTALAAGPAELRDRQIIDFGDRRWRLEIAPTAAQLASQRSWQAWTVLAAGLLFVGLLGIVLLIITGRTFRLYEGAERFRALVEASAQIVWTTNASGEVVEDSPSWRAFTGQTVEQSRGWGRADAIHPDDRIALRERWQDAVAAPRVQEGEYRIRHASGEWRWTAARAVPLIDAQGTLRGWVMSNTDITERRRAADQVRLVEAEREKFFIELAQLNAELEQRVQARTSELSASLREREVLLQEVHHRVKNNLQVISSLINMQMRKLETDTDRNALEECQTRVQAIALIHEQLYQSRDYANVPFSEYTKTLVNNVFRAMGISPGSVKLDLAIDNVAVPVDKAIPCGLLLNELITNSLKHAFKDGRSGELRVELARNDDRIRLAVKDNGIGLPAGLDVRGGKSLGLRLVNTLVRQLRGTLDIADRGGACFELSFAVENRR